MTMITLSQHLMLAQAAADPAQASGGIGAFVQMFGLPILLFAIIYFMMIRPTSKQRRQHTEMLNALKKDDEVVYGKYMGNEIEIDGQKYVIVRESDLLGVIEK